MLKDREAGFAITKKYAVYVVLLFLFCTAVQAIAQTPNRLGPGPADEIKKALIVVEANMDSLNAHRKYIFAMGMNNPLLWDQYEIWMKKYPDNVNIPLAIGTVYHRAAMAQPKDFLLKAAAINPRNAEVWYMLGVNADMGAQNDLFTEYFGKAALLDPSNAGYAYGYLKSLENSGKYEEKVFDFVKRFPEDKRGAQVIYELGRHTENLNDRIHYLEVLRELYPPEKFESTVSAMTELADIYLQTDPDKALALINEIDLEGDWKIRKQVAESIIRIDKLEADQNYTDALSNLDQL